MERHKCKLCLKGFINGRALGGHMRSHMLNLPIPQKSEADEAEEELKPGQLGEEAKLALCFPSSDEEQEKGDPKRIFLMADPEFSVTVDNSSVVLQDRESETESSKNPTRKRSRRTRKPGYLLLSHQQQSNTKQPKPSPLTESWTEPEPVSSVSDATTEEDVAFCLMMLSRDKWRKKEHEKDQNDEEGESDGTGEFESNKNRTRGNYKCETCNKVFKSYQALGGHRASHKKNKAWVAVQEREKTETENASIADKKIHECSICFRVFSSGQALGGHRRSHGTGLNETNPSKSSIRESFIDLNLPAPIDDDDMISTMSAAGR